jgi:hypothetical protein
MGMLEASGKRLDGRRQIAVTAHYVSTSSDAYVQGLPASKLQSQPEYQEGEYLD